MKTISENHVYGGTQGVYSAPSSACKCDMTFAVFTPPQANERPCPVLWYLSGLTCNHSNVMEKGEYRKMAAQLGLIIVCPDTSPRGDDVPNEADNWQMGQGAGFYLNAKQDPWSEHYQMQTYIMEELPKIIGDNFPADMTKQGIFGHSMGGHGALTLALKNPDRFKSCSAFAPIVEPSTSDWSQPSFEKYLGPDENNWRSYDATCLVKDGATFDQILIDQGSDDQFLDNGLKPWVFEKACESADIELTLRMQPGYDHSYYFISSFMDDHLKWHAERL